MTRPLPSWVFGLIGLLAIVLFTSVTWGVYRHAFSDDVEVRLDAPRAGLLLSTGADVRLRGITVGRVAAVELGPDGPRVSLAIDRDLSAHVPADVAARVVPASPVGGKYVQLAAGTGPVVTPISSGAVIEVDATVPEINNLFLETVQVLDAVPVARLNSLLSTLAGTLDGRGGEIGRLLGDLETYLGAINDRTGTIRADLELAPEVMEAYAHMAPRLVRLLRHATVTGNTLVARAQDLRALLLSAREAAAESDTLLRSSIDDLLTTLEQARPVSRVAAHYAPEYPCLLGGWSRMALDNESLGVKYPGAQAIMTFLPGQQGYTYERDLARNVDNHGPECYGLPTLSDPHPPRRYYNDGQHAHDRDGPQLEPGGVYFFPPSSMDGGAR